MIRKRIIFLTIPLIIVVILIIVFCCTRTVYWHHKYYEDQKPKQTDAEYLGVWDVRLIIHSSKDKEVKNLGISLINSSYENNGELPQKYKGIVSDKIFKYMNPRYALAKLKDNIINEEFHIQEASVLSHNNKAIFLWGYTYTADYYRKNGQPTDIGIGYDGTPHRLYLEYVNGQWVIVSANILF